MSGEIAVGAPDKVEQCMYAAVITRVEEDLDNELTAGWKIIEVCPFYGVFYLWIASVSIRNETNELSLT